MPMAILTALAPICAALHLWIRRVPPTPGRVFEVFLLWWLALAVGVAGVVGAAFHVFDGPAIAEMIGFTRGDGGFQFENAMGDLAIGIAGLLCIWIRGNFWLATIVVTSIQYYGDAVGHVHQWLANGNTEPGNIGIPLYLDVIVPVVATVLYVLMRRARRDEVPSPPTPSGAPAPEPAPVLVGDR